MSTVRKTRLSRSDRLIRRAVMKIAAYTAERALLNELNYQIALEILRSAGLFAREESAAVTTVVLDERLSRYAK